MKGPTPSELDSSIERARAYLLDRQRSDGSWYGVCHGGVHATATTLLICRYLGALSEADAAAGCRWLRCQQRTDGSFPASCFVRGGNPEATALAAAALSTLGGDRDQAVSRAMRYVDQHGGLRALSPLVRAVLALSGRGGRHGQLPVPLLVNRLIPGVDRLLAQRLSAPAMMQLHALIGLVLGLRGRGRRWSRARGPEGRGIVDYLSARQGRRGDWFGTGYNTVLVAGCLHALGVPSDDERIRRGLAFNEECRITERDGLQFRLMPAEVMDTLTALRALLDSGLAGETPAIERAVRFLVAHRCRRPTPREWQNPRRSGPRHGGWGWYADDDFLADCDNTNWAVDALQRAGSSGAARGARDDGLAWLLAMQNDDGGWPAFTRGHPEKPPGPLKSGSLRELFGDPSWEDITGRVLSTLGRLGMTVDDPPVQRAVRFVERQRAANGVWWGRWGINYLMSTACVLGGLAAVGEDMSRDYVRDAVRWVVDRQNPDGGWGELPASYRDIARAGIGPSQPTVTGFVVGGLVDAGEATSAAVARGVRLLLDSQRHDGSWEETAAQGVLFPSLELFYYTDMMTIALPLSALSRYRDGIHPARSARASFARFETPRRR